MAPATEGMYEAAVLKARAGFIWRAALAVFWPAAALVLWGWFAFPNSWVARAGALMSVTAYLADLKAQEMAAVFTPSGLVDRSFAGAKARYSGQVNVCKTLARSLVVLGGLVWGFADLLP